MAPINQINTGEQDYEASTLSSWLATICLMAGMIVSLVGIKIWWFKHRLTFEQNATQNGAAGGSQPILKSVTKDKRSSQQVVDSVVAHGIFRKRGEDELDILDRPRQLPPIRIPERSQSTSALVPPPRAKRSGNITPEVTTTTTTAPVPRMQQPPPLPPQQYALKQHDQQSQAEVVEETHVVEPDKGEFRRDLTTVQQESIYSEPTASQRLFRKVNLPKAAKPLEQQNSERRATGFMSPEDALELDQWLVEKENNTVASNAELDDSSLTNWAPNAEDSWDSKSKQSEIDEPQVMDSTANWLSSYAQKSADNEQIWQEMGVPVDTQNLTAHLEQEFDKIRHSLQAHEAHFLELGNERQRRIEIKEIQDDDDGDDDAAVDSFNESAYKQQDYNNIAMQHDWETSRRPATYGASIDEDWFDERNPKAKAIENETKDLINTVEYARVEKKTKFAQDTNFEHDSNIAGIAKNSNYEETYANDTKIVAQQYSNTNIGFEKFSNIEQNTSFETLSNTEEILSFKENLNVEQLFADIEKVSNFVDQSDFKAISKTEQHTNFNLMQFVETDEEFSNNEQQLLSSATAYVQSIEELYDELSDQEQENTKTDIFEDVPLNTTTTTMISPKTSILKERLQNFENSDYEAPTAKSRKLKSQQKVTFDFNTEEYYLPEHETESDDEAEAEDVKARHYQYDEEDEEAENEAKSYFKRQTKAFYGQTEFEFENENENDDEEVDYEKEMPKIPPPPLPRTAAPTPMQRTTTTTTKRQIFNEQTAEAAELAAEARIVEREVTKSSETFSETWTASTTSQQTIIKTTKSESSQEVADIFQQQIQQQQTAGLLFSTQISLDESDEQRNENFENDSWTAIRQRRYKQVQQQQQQQHIEQKFEEAQEYFIESSEFKLKPQASPRLAPRQNHHVRAPAPRTTRKTSYDDFEHSATEA